MANARRPHSYETRSLHAHPSFLKASIIAVHAGQAPGGDALSHLHRFSDQLLYRRHRNAHLCRRCLGCGDIAGRPFYERICDSGILCGRRGARRLGPAPSFLAEHRGHAGNRRGDPRFWQRDRNSPCRRGAPGLRDGVRPAHRHILSSLPHRRSCRAQRHQLRHRHVFKREYHRWPHAGRLCRGGCVVARGVRTHDALYRVGAHCRLGL